MYCQPTVLPLGLPPARCFPCSNLQLTSPLTPAPCIPFLPAGNPMPAWFVSVGFWIAGSPLLPPFSVAAAAAPAQPQHSPSRCRFLTFPSLLVAGTAVVAILPYYSPSPFFPAACSLGSAGQPHSYPFIYPLCQPYLMYNGSPATCTIPSFRHASLYLPAAMAQRLQPCPTLPSLPHLGLPGCGSPAAMQYLLRRLCSCSPHHSGNSWRATAVGAGGPALLCTSGPTRWPLRFSQRFGAPSLPHSC